MRQTTLSKTTRCNASAVKFEESEVIPKELDHITSGETAPDSASEDVKDRLVRTEWVPWKLLEKPGTRL